MRQFKNSYILLIILMFLVGPHTWAQALVNGNQKYAINSRSNKLTTTKESKLAMYTFTSPFLYLPIGGCNPPKLNVEKPDTAIRTSAILQDLLIFNLKLQTNQAKAQREKLERAREVQQDNEYVITGEEKGSFPDNPLLLDGQPLDYGDFGLSSTGELKVIKKDTGYGELIEVPFYIYLRRNGNKISLPGRSTQKHTKIEISEILRYSQPGDHLIIEAVNKEDGAVKRILKLMQFGC